MARETTRTAKSTDTYTNYGYALSILLHALIVGFAYTGLPSFFERDPPEEAPLIIDVVEIADITSAAPPPQPELKPEPTPPTPEPPKPQLADAPPPDAAMPPPPEPEKPKPEPIKAPEPPKVKPPPPKPTPPKTKQDDVAMLQKLLKDMQKSQPKAASPATESKANPTNNVAPNVSDRASMTELDAIRRHIEGCWRIDPGKEGIENLAADIKVFINPDGSVREAQIVDMTRYFVDSAFRTFANSARNAVLGCGNIPISPERYSTFKEMTMTFSPQGRIN
ncbi:MAG: TonB C-terminal domain-containing protein [Rhodospirillaceae bacterium]|nr:TonB C-terminal domain-containing protein [Rhodospirillaceae bacterium]